MEMSSIYGEVMILFDLHCATGHRFEGWFRSNESFDEQQAAGAIVCPSCGKTDVAKAPMAPHVMRSVARQADAAPGVGALPQKIREDMQALRSQVESTCDYVGLDFPKEARRIHYGEVDARNIYGEATEREAKELESEGVAFRKIPWFPRRND
jgi:hypothetical protein